MQVTRYHIHAVLQLTAFCLVFPLGIAVAVFRSYIGSSWLWIHIIAQCIGVILVTTAILVVSNNHEHKDKTTQPHKVMGKVVFGLLVAEILWAILGRRLGVPYQVWLIVHVCLAIAIVCGGWINIYLAVKMRSRCKDEADCSD